MPYKDLERKKEWEHLHRPQRLARRRELRRIEAERALSANVHELAGPRADTFIGRPAHD
jgi:hypothetical protein